MSGLAARWAKSFGGSGVSGPSTLFMASFSPQGAHRWSKAYDCSTCEAYGMGVATDASGAVVLTGSFIKSVELGGPPLVGVSALDVFLARLSRQ